MLSLVLRTRGMFSNLQFLREEVRDSRANVAKLRSSEKRKREVDVDNLLNSSTTLCVVPDTLVSHWKSQIEQHIVPGYLKVFVDNDLRRPLPPAEDLLCYDLVLTTLNRLGTEWQRGKPRCALEARMPVRLGFEDQIKFNSGEIIKGLSPLLRIHWVRVIVDEGHKLGGLSITNQSQMARWQMTS